MDYLDEVLEGLGYMADDYGPAAWKRIADFLLKQGHSRDETAAIMRSKHARWADDSEGRGNGKTCNSAAFVRYYEKQAERFDWMAEGRSLAAETYGY